MMKRKRTIILASVCVVIIVAACVWYALGERPVELPEDFPKITAKGESKIRGEYYTTFNGVFGFYIIRMNEKGQVMWYKKIQDFNAKRLGKAVNFQPATADDVGSFYFEVCGKRTSAQANSELVLLDDAYNEIERIRYKLSKDRITDKIMDSLAVDSHDAIVFGRDSYIICGSRNEYVKNIPADIGYKGKETACVEYIQEVDNGKVKWEFRSADYPEFYRYKVGKKSKADSFRNDFTDYMHFNSMTIDPSDNNLLVSFRNQCAIVKLNRKTGKVMWILGGKGDEFGLKAEETFACQHSISFTEEGNLLMYDSRIEGEASRILEFALDEKKKTAKVVRRVQLDADSITWGHVQKLDENTYMINEGATPDLDRKNGFYELDVKTGKRQIDVYTDDSTESYWTHKEQSSTKKQ